MFYCLGTNLSFIYFHLGTSAPWRRSELQSQLAWLAWLPFHQKLNTLVQDPLSGKRQTMHCWGGWCSLSLRVYWSSWRRTWLLTCHSEASDGAYASPPFLFSLPDRSLFNSVNQLTSWVLGVALPHLPIPLPFCKTGSRNECWLVFINPRVNSWCDSGTFQ